MSLEPSLDICIEICPPLRVFHRFLRSSHKNGLPSTHCSSSAEDISPTLRLPSSTTRSAIFYRVFSCSNKSCIVPSTARGGRWREQQSTESLQIRAIPVRFECRSK